MRLTREIKKYKDEQTMNCERDQERVQNSNTWNLWSEQGE